jgi:hypothetical protein
MRACRGRVAAHGVDGGGNQVSGSGDQFHLAHLSHVGGFGSGCLSLVPASGVGIRPSECGQPGAAGAPHARALEPLHGILEQGHGQVGFVEQPRGGTDAPQSGFL